MPRGKEGEPQASEPVATAHRSSARQPDRQRSRGAGKAGRRVCNSMMVGAQRPTWLRRCATLRFQLVGSAPAAADTEAQTLPTHPNPSTVVDVSTNLAGWMRTDVRRREGFHFPNFGMQGITIRSPSVLALTSAPNDRIASLTSVQRAVQHRCFSGMAVVKGTQVVYEQYAADFGPEMAHSMQSVTKTCMHLIIGQLVARNKLSLSDQIKSLVPEIGSGYSEATVQQVLDMAVVNNFSEGYDDNAYSPEPKPGETIGYSRQEISMGWRLVPPGETAKPRTMADFIGRIERTEGTIAGYKSPNNDLLGVIAERVTGQSLRELLVEVMAGAGLEGTFHCNCDSSFFPVVSGAGFMSARDLCRYGLLFARGCIGVDGKAVGSRAFMQAALDAHPSALASAEPGGAGGGDHESVWYKNQLQTNGRWVGHGGFGGQWMAADPQSGASLAYFSVFDNAGGVGSLTEMTDEIFDVLLQ
eukprot:COSAG05_NODE_560_length_8675_cov_18.684235_1_plen_471_part_00